MTWRRLVGHLMSRRGVSEEPRLLSDNVSVAFGPLEVVSWLLYKLPMFLFLLFFFAIFPFLVFFFKQFLFSSFRYENRVQPFFCFCRRPCRSSTVFFISSSFSSRWGRFGVHGRRYSDCPSFIFSPWRRGYARRNVRITPEQSPGHVPQLVDEDVVVLEDDREDEADPPVGDVPPAELPSVLTPAMLEVIARTCRFPSRLQMRVPTSDERPWTAPPGWVCLYEAFFTHSRLWFPLPRLLTLYAAARDIALTQFTPAAMRNVVVALVMGAEVGIDVDIRFFEELANISRNPGTRNTFYINIKSRHGILRGRVNNAHEWFQRYFFVRVDSASVVDLDAILRGTWNPLPSESLVLSLSSSWFACEFIFVFLGISLELHPISLPPPTGFSSGVERIRELGIQQWSDFDRDRIFRSVPRISAGMFHLMVDCLFLTFGLYLFFDSDLLITYFFLASWGASPSDRSGRRGRSSSRLAPAVAPRRAARSPSVRTGGVCRDIPPYSSVMNDEVTSPSFREGNMGMAQSDPLNHDVEPERAFGGSVAVNAVASGGGEPVRVERGASGGAPKSVLMADAIRSEAREGRESRSLKRPSEDVPVEEVSSEKMSRHDPYAWVFQYIKDTPLVNDERDCAEYFCLPRNAFTDNPDVENLVHAQKFKDMSCSTAQVFLLLFWSGYFCSSWLKFFFLSCSRMLTRCGLCTFTKGIFGGYGPSWRKCFWIRSHVILGSTNWKLQLMV